MPDWKLPSRQSRGAYVAGSMLPKRNFLLGSIRECNAEGGLLVDRSRNRAYIRIVSEDAQKMSLTVVPDVAIDPQADAGRGLLRKAHIFKQPEPQVRILHWIRPPSLRKFLSA